MPHRVELVTGNKARILYQGTCPKEALKQALRQINSPGRAFEVKTTRTPRSSVLRLTVS